MTNTDDNSAGADHVKSHFSTYQEYNKLLRSWFVAFGAGGPALILVNDKVREMLDALNVAIWVVICFLAGALFQILSAFLNKIVNWCIYYGEEESHGFKQHKIYRAATALSSKFWIDVAFDAATCVVFGVAVCLMVYAAHESPVVPPNALKVDVGLTTGEQTLPRRAADVEPLPLPPVRNEKSSIDSAFKTQSPEPASGTKQHDQPNSD